MNIYVGNMPYAATETHLEELFQEYGPVATVTIIRDRDNNNRSKGFGFVEMENQEGGARAIEALDGQEMMGRTLKVNPARPREQRGKTQRYERRDRRENPPSDRTSSTDNENRYFHNPYTFVPTPPREKAIKQGEFAGDFNPLDKGLDHASLKNHLWTGHIPIKLTTVTPLVLLKNDGEQQDSTDPQTYDVHDRIPESSLRGMLRSAYEVVTNSRYGGFGKEHQEKLAYRMDTGEALKLIPAIIKKDEDTGKLKAHLYTGTSYPTKNGPKKVETRRGQKPTVQQDKESAMYAAMLTCYKNRTPKTDLQGRYSDPETGDEVYAELFLCRKSRYRYWKASRVWLKSHCSTTPNPGSVPRTWRNVSLCKDSQSKPIVQVVEGTVLVTNENIDRKHDERIFFCNNPIEKEITDDHEKAWEKLIENYRDAHPDDDIFNRKDENGNAKKPWHWFKKNRDTTQWAWSPHLFHNGKHKDRWGGTPDDALKLREGTMVYARCKFKNGKISGIENLFPVTISRELYENSPNDLLATSRLTPAKNLNELSPADRLFGWVLQNQEQKQEQKQEIIGDYKSRIRVVCENEAPSDIEDFSDDPLPLAILGEPKPAQGRFYVAKDKQGNPQGDRLSKKEAGYNDGKGLRGRKHYWHHKGKVGDYWNPRIEKESKEYLRAEGKTDSQNRSIKGWIKPKNEFKASLYVQNLQPQEIGALLWLLKVNDEIGDDEEMRCFRLGYGKPLGFGSVRMEIDTERLINDHLPLGTGEDWRTYYTTFNSCPPATLSPEQQNCCLKEFKESMADAYNPLQGNKTINDSGGENRSSNRSFSGQLAAELSKTSEGQAQFKERQFDNLAFIKAFLRILKGPVGDSPIHYPRLDPKPDPDGKNYAWFVANERGISRRESGRDEMGKQLALPDVYDEKGLPYIPSKPKT